MASLAFLFCVHISLFLHFIKAYLGRWQTGHTCLFLTEVLSKDFDRRLQCGVGSLALDFLFINVSVLDNSRNNMFLLPKHRQVLLEIFSKNYRVRRNMIQARLTQECGEDLSKQEVDKVLKDCCVSYGGMWYLKGTVQSWQQLQITNPVNPSPRTDGRASRGGSRVSVASEDSEQEELTISRPGASHCPVDRGDHTQPVAGSP